MPTQDSSDRLEIAKVQIKALSQGTVLTVMRVDVTLWSRESGEASYS